MSDVYIFKRYEKKYRITREQMERLLSRISDKLVPDAHGKSTVCSLYLDTPDFLLIRNSIDAVSYKEKLRIRSYGIPSEDSRVFFEIKKKYKDIVYKRRVPMTYSEAAQYLATAVPPKSGQIMDEIDWAMGLYGHPKPSVLICYEREAYFSSEADDLRITFDMSLRYRRDRLTPDGGTAGQLIIPEGDVIMEIKTGGGMPLWLASALDAETIYPQKFSKYANAYRDICEGGLALGTGITEKGRLQNV